MANKLQISSRVSTKRIAIDKANTQMVAAVAVAAFLTVFSLIAARALWQQASYQNRVLSAQHKASDQLKKNLKTAQQLDQSYKAFVGTTKNVIGGDPNGDGPKDGDNATIVLHALPSQYDFPALASSLEKILFDRNLQVDGIGGTDDQLAQQANTGSGSPVAVEMPFTFSVKGAGYKAIQDLTDDLQRSIRPIQIDTLALTGGGSSMQMSVSAHTFYQPEKILNIKEKAVK